VGGCGLPGRKALCSLKGLPKCDSHRRKHSLGREVRKCSFSRTNEKGERHENLQKIPHVQYPTISTHDIKTRSSTHQPEVHFLPDANPQSSTAKPKPTDAYFETHRMHTNAVTRTNVRPCVTKLTVRRTSIGCSRSATTPSGGGAAAVAGMVNSKGPITILQALISIRFRPLPAKTGVQMKMSYPYKPRDLTQMFCSKQQRYKN
jgi:hypothetical protein